ncbi:glycosyl transferase family 4 [Dyella terrae]|uniref:glycosyl transferase family 4 n=1 Tax=Dyella terrae TaxID=522259 RepID=UPI001F0E696D|nr:glycosyl transferase family 4 [Dyella terrae]
MIAFLLTGPWCLATMPAAWGVAVAMAMALATVMVAGIGWWDDHRSLPVLPRLGVQLAACALFAGAALVGGAHSWWWFPVLVLAGAWSINLHNFMDGIDGLLAQQAIFVGAGFALLGYAAGQFALSVSVACLVAGTFGFWCFNRPRASIFMGDVGSGTMGFLLFAFTLLLWEADWRTLWPALTLNSSFVMDATLTLGNRYIKGRRWYAPHREHLYQWLVRSGMSHAQGGACYLIWNLAIAAPLAVLSWNCPDWGVTITAMTYIAAGAAWMLGKRRCLWRIKHKAIHVTT